MTGGCWKANFPSISNGYPVRKKLPEIASKSAPGLNAIGSRAANRLSKNSPEQYDWDYLIGSVHYLGDWDFDNPKWLGKWAETDVDAVWTEYWKTYADMAESGLFDILGHPDLVKKFSYAPEGDLDRFYDPVIEVIAANGSVIELNTAGLHKPCAEAYPAPRFLELAASAGIGLVISSDAHAPSEVARDFPKARALAKAAGYRETQLFEKRRRSGEPCL